MASEVADGRAAKGSSSNWLIARLSIHTHFFSFSMTNKSTISHCLSHSGFHILYRCFDLLKQHTRKIDIYSTIQFTLLPSFLNNHRRHHRRPHVDNNFFLFNNLRGNFTLIIFFNLNCKFSFKKIKFFTL